MPTPSIGVDLGGTKIEIIVANVSNGHIDVRAQFRRPTNRDNGYDAVLETVRSTIVDAAAMAQISLSEAHIGVGMPGSITRRDGLIKNSNTTCLNGRPFQQDLCQILGKQISFENDANCFALAETKLGAAKAFRENGIVFGVILGTGVGGGIVAHGNIWDGPHHIAGEWGHHTLWPESDLTCYCGKHGCVELFVSGPALEQSYYCQSNNPLRLAEIAQRADIDKHAATVMDSFLDSLGRALANVINILDPSVIVLGGGVSNLECLYSQLPSYVAKHVFNDELLTPILKHELGDSAGVYGAALLSI